MPSLSHLVVIPCPNGIKSANTARVSVVLVPRLRVNGTLADYPDFADWGAQVANLKFRLYDGNTPVASPVTVTSVTVDPAVWQAVFGKTPTQLQNVNVNAAAFVDRTQTSLTSMNAAGAFSGMSTIMRAIAALGPLGAQKSSIVNTGINVSGLADDYENFAGTIGNGATPTYNDPDFHEVLRQIGAHPHLMRQLGLVFDLEFGLPATPPAEIQVRTNWPGFGSNQVDFEDHRQIPLRMEVDSNFEPLSALPAYRTGRWLALGSSKYAVSNGNIVDTGQALSSLRRRLDGLEATAPVSVPATDETGLTVSHTEVVTMLESTFDRQRQLEDDIDRWIQNTPPTVQPPRIRGEDATVGTRWDVMDVAKNVYRSLHERRPTGSYEFPRSPALNVTAPRDEGWSTLAISTDGTFTPAPKASSVVYSDTVPKVELSDNTQWRVDSSVVRWSGWSLSTPKPGRILDPSGAAQDRAPRSPQVGDPAQIGVEYEVVPGTLERLRFNHSYRFRARCVDLAGNSLPLTASAPATAVSPSVIFGRTAPIPEPSVVRRSSRPDPGVGDLPETMVIKSELTQTNSAVAGSDRMLFVPRINQLRLEHHGLPRADGIDVADYAFLADRDARTLPGQLLADPETGEPVAGAAVIGNIVTPGRYRQKALYLADPAARRIAFHRLPRGSATTPILVDVGTWPDPESVVLELKAGAAAPRVTTAAKRVTVQLPKGTIATCQVSCAVDPTLLSHFAWWQALSAADRNRLRRFFLNGQVELVSTRRTITLVHAVRVPLAAPSLGGFSGARTTEGQTTVLLDGAVALHRPSSERLVVRGKWDGPDFDTPVIAMRQSGVVLDRFVSTTGSAARETLTEVPLELGSTRRMKVTLDAEVFCRFSSYFTERREWTATKGSSFVADARGMSSTAVVVSNPGSGEVFTEGVDYSVDRTAGTVTPLETGAINNATLTRIEYIPLPVSRPSAQARRGRSVTFVVPSSARPPVPKVSHVLPAFSRRVKNTPTKITVTHDGRVLRAFLERPWNESGAGELLGVATDLPGVAATALSLTRWGRDPLNVGAGARVRPGPTSFQKAVATVANIDGRFGVAGHRPVLDTQRNLWLADIQVNAAFGYRPFVQLHLCRYQPDSLAGLHVSDTVSTETLRLGAQRVVTFTKKPGRQVEVKLVGPDRVNTVTVRLQQVDPTINDPDLRWVDVGAPVTLTRTGSTSLATHTGAISAPAAAVPRRLVVEDSEPVSREQGGVLVGSLDVAYREVVQLPTAW